MAFNCQRKEFSPLKYTKINLPIFNLNWWTHKSTLYYYVFVPQYTLCYFYRRSSSLSLYLDKWIHKLRIRIYRDSHNRLDTILPITFFLISGEECRTSSECNGSKGLCCKLIRRARSQPKKVRNSFLVVSILEIRLISYGSW